MHPSLPSNTTDKLKGKKRGPKPKHSTDNKNLLRRQRVQACVMIAPERWHDLYTIKMKGRNAWTMHGWSTSLWYQQRQTRHDSLGDRLQGRGNQRKLQPQRCHSGRVFMNFANRRATNGTLIRC